MKSSEQSVNVAAPRWRLQISLRTFLILVVVACAVIGIVTKLTIAYLYPPLTPYQKLRHRMLWDNPRSLVGWEQKKAWPKHWRDEWFVNLDRWSQDGISYCDDNGDGKLSAKIMEYSDDGPIWFLDSDHDGSFDTLCANSAVFAGEIVSYPLDEIESYPLGVTIPVPELP